MKRCIRALAALSYAVCGAAYANEAGWPDPFFGDGGRRLVDLDAAYAPDDEFHAMATAPDGRIVAIGRATNRPFHLPVRSEPGVARLTAEGALDHTFAGTGRLLLGHWLARAGVLFYDSGVRAGINGVAVQNDGKIVVVGSAVTATASGMLVARIAASGGLDTTFGTDGIAIVPFDLGAATASGARAVVIQNDGKIVVAGMAIPDGGSADIAVARLHANGAIDTTFSVDGRTTIAFDLGTAPLANADIGRALALQADGKIVVAGSAQTPNGTDSVIARLNTNGALDPAFGNLATGKSRIYYVTAQDDVAEAVAVSELPTRRIVVAGHTKTPAGDSDMAVGVLDAGGVADIGFDGDGRVTVPFNLGGTNRDVAIALKIQTKVQNIGGFPLVTRRIVVAGYATNAQTRTVFALARLSFNGALDTTFGNGGKSTFAWDNDGDGVPNNGGALAMDDQGTMAIVGGQSMVTRADGASDRAWVVGRVVLEP